MSLIKAVISISFLLQSCLCTAMVYYQARIATKQPEYTDLFPEHNFINFADPEYAKIEKKFKERFDGVGIPTIVIKETTQHEIRYKAVPVNYLLTRSVLGLEIENIYTPKTWQKCNLQPKKIVPQQKAIPTKKELFDKIHHKQELITQLSNENAHIEKEIALRKAAIQQQSLPARNPDYNVKKQKNAMIRYLIKRFEVETVNQVKYQLQQLCRAHNITIFYSRYSDFCTWTYTDKPNKLGSLTFNTNDRRANDQSPTFD